MTIRSPVLFYLQIERIVSDYGLVVITREGSNPSKYIYEHDIVHRFMVRYSSIIIGLSNSSDFGAV